MISGYLLAILYCIVYLEYAFSLQCVYNHTFVQFSGYYIPVLIIILQYPKCNLLFLTLRLVADIQHV